MVLSGAPSAEDLLALARDRSVEHRKQLSLTLVDLLRNGDAVLTDRERAMMTDILRRLLGEMEMEVRRTLSQRLADDPQLPHTLACDLANDRIEVAWPVLMRSQVLNDMDLVEIVLNRSMEHRLVVAQRGNLSEVVTDALIRSDEGDVIVTLLKNRDARLSHAAMVYLTEQSRRVDDFQEPLLHRNELTPALAKRMFFWVSAALRDHIAQRFGLTASSIDALMEDALETLFAQPAPADSERKLLDEMKKADMLDPTLMVRTLEAGLVGLYLGVVERLTGIRRQLAARFLFEAAGEGLAVQCRAVDLPKADFLALYSIARKARPTPPDQLQKDIAALGDLYGSMTSDAARAVVLRWRRSSDYLAALRALEMVGNV